jgi:transposase InsO family protein
VRAGDFSQTPCRIEDEYDRLLLVRDLGSGMQLLAQPARSENAWETCVSLEALMAEEGAPLVLKLDNGAGFIAEATQTLLESYGVLVLHSPARTPSYNGSCEAGGGSIKMRARRLAGSEGRPAAWTMNDVEAARCEANERCRDSALPTPAAVWAARSPITAQERAALREAYEAALARELAALELTELPWRDFRIHATLMRRALTSALLQRDYLAIWKGRVCPLNCRRKRSIIS